MSLLTDKERAELQADIVALVREHIQGTTMTDRECIEAFWAISCGSSSLARKHGLFENQIGEYL